jgi:hypothetical protein
MTLLAVGQPSNTEDRAALSGTWNLNRELSQATPSGEGRDTGRGRGRDGGLPGGGPPPDGGGRGEFGGRGGFGGDPPGDFGGSRPDPEQLKQTRALLDELMTAAPRLSIFQRDGLRIAFVDSDGHTRTFTADGKKERHQLKAGTLETSTKWDGATLVQQSAAGGGVTVTQTFALDDARRLVISTTLDNARMGKASPNKSVYEREDER